jgi:hypothetical protein
MTDQEVQPFLAYPAIIILLARVLGMAAKRARPAAGARRDHRRHRLPPTATATLT